MFTTIDKAFAAILGAVLPLLFLQLGDAPEFLGNFSDTAAAIIQVGLPGLLAWAVPNKARNA